MRNTLSCFAGYRKAALLKRNPKTSPTRLAEVDSYFRVLDGMLNGVRVNEYDQLDDPETKLQETMTSGDFPLAIGTFVSRKMDDGYVAKMFDFEPLVKPDTLPNFLPVQRYQNRAGVDDLEWVGEKGEARPGSIDDAVQRQYQVEVWEKQFDFSMRALVNDDLGYFEDAARKMGIAARRTQEKFVARMMFNAVTLARLIGLGALFFTAGRLSTPRLSGARMAFNQRVDARGEPVVARLKYVVHHSGLVDTVSTIQNSQLVPEFATNAANVVKSTFVPIECPYIVGVAPNLPWFAFADWKENNITPFILARRQGVPAPQLFRKKSDMEMIGSLTGGGTSAPPIMGDFATGNVVIKVHDEWGTYIDGTEGNLYDFRGAYYGQGIAW